jgi:hypothetical protein
MHDVLRSPIAGRRGSRFDDTVALPVDAPRRLDDIIRSAADRLRLMPPSPALDHRGIQVREQLRRTMREATQARIRLATGAYGTCTECEGPISLTLLIDRPWTPLCIYCALDI